MTQHTPFNRFNNYPDRIYSNIRSREDFLKAVTPQAGDKEKEKGVYLTPFTQGNDGRWTATAKIPTTDGENITGGIIVTLTTPLPQEDSEENTYPPSGCPEDKLIIRSYAALAGENYGESHHMDDGTMRFVLRLQDVSEAALMGLERFFTRVVGSQPKGQERSAKRGRL